MIFAALVFILVQYLDSYHDKDIKSFYIILDTYEVNKSSCSLAANGSSQTRILGKLNIRKIKNECRLFFFSF